MQAKRLQHLLVSGDLSTTGVTLLMFGAWAFSYLFYTQPIEHLYLLTIDINITPLISYVAGALCYLLIALLLLWLNKEHTLIRERTSVEAHLYLLTGACCLLLHPISQGLLASVFLVLALHFLMHSFQMDYSQGDLFHCFLMLGIGCLIYPKLVFVTPIFLIASAQFLSLHIRSFVAALLGFMIPFWFLLAYALLAQDLDILVAPLLVLSSYYPLGVGYELWQLPLYGLLVLLFIVSAIHTYSTTFDDKMRTRMYLRFLIALSAFLLICLALQPHEAIDVFPLAAVPISLLAGHFFALTGNRASAFFTVFCLLAYVALFIFSLWTL